MDEKDYIRKKIERLDTVPDEFVSAVTKVQKSIVADLTRLMDQLEVKDGKILLTEKNLALIETISARINDILFKGKYIDAVKGFITQFPVQADYTNEYFKETFGKLFEPQEIFEKVLKESQKNAVGLLSEGAVQANFIKPLKEILAQSVTTGATFSESIITLTNFIIGTPELDGRLTKYVKTIAYDNFAVADRQYTNAIATAIDVEFYRYVGGLMTDSRDFCKERNNKFFHHKEIEAWGNIKQWQGRNPATNSSTIFNYAGGFQCKHSILPVSTFSVPKETLERAEKKGFYTPKKR